MHRLAREEIFLGTPSELEAAVEHMMGRSKVDTATGEVSSAETLEELIERVTSQLDTLDSYMANVRKDRADLRAQLKERGVLLKAFDRAREELQMHHDQRLDAYRTQCSIVRRVLRVPEQMELLP